MKAPAAHPSWHHVAWLSGVLALVVGAWVTQKVRTVRTLDTTAAGGAPTHTAPLQNTAPTPTLSPPIANAPTAVAQPADDEREQLSERDNASWAHARIRATGNQALLTMVDDLEAANARYDEALAAFDASQEPLQRAAQSATPMPPALSQQVVAQGDRLMEKVMREEQDVYGKTHALIDAYYAFQAAKVRLN